MENSAPKPKSLWGWDSSRSYRIHDLCLPQSISMATNSTIDFPEVSKLRMKFLHNFLAVLVSNWPIPLEISELAISRTGNVRSIRLEIYQHQATVDSEIECLLGFNFKPSRIWINDLDSRQGEF